MAEAKKIKPSVILPPEIVEKILKLLNLQEICKAQLICRRWKEIIRRGNILKKYSGKILEPF